MPNLEELVFEEGVCSVRTSQLFRTVKSLHFNCVVDPDGGDLLSDEQVAQVSKFSIGKTLRDYDKGKCIIMQLASLENSAASNLQHLSVNFSGIVLTPELITKLMIFCPKLHTL